MYPLNPKAMSVIELYGILDPDTRDWTDGILSNIFRDINKPTDKKERRWGKKERKITERSQMNCCKIIKDT